MTSLRIGFGVDAHRLIDRAAGADGVILGGIAVDSATSDGDVLAHALCDAFLGAAALGDVGELFPSNDPRWVGADSMMMLGVVLETLADAGFRPAQIDTTVIAELVKVAPFREEIRANLAATLSIDIGATSVKATTTDGLGFLGRGEGLAATALVTIEPIG